MPRLGWDMKATHKLIVMSQTYRQSSQGNPDLLAKDPDNQLLARGPKRRLSAVAALSVLAAASVSLAPSAAFAKDPPLVSRSHSLATCKRKPRPNFNSMVSGPRS